MFWGAEFKDKLAVDSKSGIIDLHLKGCSLVKGTSAQLYIKQNKKSILLASLSQNNSQVSFKLNLTTESQKLEFETQGDGTVHLFGEAVRKEDLESSDDDVDVVLPKVTSVADLLKQTSKAQPKQVPPVKDVQSKVQPKQNEQKQKTISEKKAEKVQEKQAEPQKQKAKSVEVPKVTESKIVAEIKKDLKKAGKVPRPPKEKKTQKPAPPAHKPGPQKTYQDEVDWSDEEVIQQKPQKKRKN